MTSHPINNCHPMFKKTPFIKPYNLGPSNTPRYHSFICKYWWVLYCEQYYSDDSGEDYNPCYNNDKMILNYFTAYEHNYFRNNYRTLDENARVNLSYRWGSDNGDMRPCYLSVSDQLHDALLEKLSKKELIGIIINNRSESITIYTHNIKELLVKDKIIWNRKTLILDY